MEYNLISNVESCYIQLPQLLYYSHLPSIVVTLTSQKAISLAPAVSFVAVIESLVPVFVMMFSLFLIQIMKVSGHTAVGDVYKGQLSGAGIKILALTFVAIGIYTVA